MSKLLGLKLYGQRKITKDEATELYNLGHKYCPDCDRVKPHSDFGIHKKRWDGLQGICRSCTTSRNYLARNSTSLNDKKKRWLTANDLTVQEILEMPFSVLEKLDTDKRVEYIETKIENNGLYRYMVKTRRTSYKR